MQRIEQSNRNILQSTGAWGLRPQSKQKRVPQLQVTDDELDCAILVAEVIHSAFAGIMPSKAGDKLETRAGDVSWSV